MRVLLISTYELGRQPVHLASPAAALAAAGVETECLDLSVQELEAASLEGVDAVAFSIPMHTAMRLAVASATAVRKYNPELPIAFYGLYAEVGRDHHLGRVTDAIFCGEYEPDLVSWVTAVPSHEADNSVRVNLGRTDFLVPRRSGLPPLTEYARLEHEGEARIVGAVEASHGCRHRCKHCPIPSVYDGRLRVVGDELVQADIDQLVDMGAQHITFGDADFLNAPAYSMGLLETAHRKHPELTFDITVKVEHILKHRELWPAMANLGVLFVVSAFESVDDRTLRILDKGHTVADMAEAVKIIHQSGIHLRPTWLPFVPWTTPRDIADIFAFLDNNNLAPSIDPVQLAIKVLIPEGSLLVEQPDFAPYLERFDPEALTWLWEFDSPEAERLHKELDLIAAEASDCQEDSRLTLNRMRQTVESVSGVALGSQPDFDFKVPRLSESWFCCAEPTAGQATTITTIGIGSKRG